MKNEYKAMTQKKLNEMIASHKLWLECKEGGEQLNIDGYNLSEMNFEYADLSYCIMDNCCFKGANFRKATLYHCTMNNCDFSNAVLMDCELAYSSLYQATFINTDLRFAIIECCNICDSLIIDSNFFNSLVAMVNFNCCRQIDNMGVHNATFKLCQIESLKGHTLTEQYTIE